MFSPSSSLIYSCYVFDIGNQPYIYPISSDLVNTGQKCVCSLTAKSALSYFDVKVTEYQKCGTFNCTP